jgi:ribosome-associated protein
MRYHGPLEGRNAVPDVNLAPGVWIPDAALDYRAARSGGPGGQHVNKVETKIELRVELAAITGLSEGARERLRALAGHRLLPSGQLAIVAQESRHQFANKQLALEKLMALVASALVPPKPRRATRPTKGSKERRLGEKKKDADKKRGRGRVDY